MDGSEVWGDSDVAISIIAWRGRQRRRAEAAALSTERESDEDALQAWLDDGGSSLCERPT